MEAVKELNTPKKNHSEMIDKLREGSIPLKWVGFHAATGMPGVIADATTYNTTKQPGLKMFFHPPSSLILIEIKGKSFVTHATSAKGMEFDLGK